jgi:hypothetical protein
MPINGYTNKKKNNVYSLNFAEDQVVIAQDHDDMEFMARKLKEEYEKWGLTMNLEKTKYVSIGEGKESLKFDSGEEIKPSTECTYLGTKIDYTGDNTAEIKHRINQTRKAINALNSIWWHKDIIKIMYLPKNNSEHFDVWSRSMANTYQRNKQDFIHINGCAKEISKKIKVRKNKK